LSGPVVHLFLIQAIGLLSYVSPLCFIARFLLIVNPSTLIPQVLHWSRFDHISALTQPLFTRRHSL